MGQFRAVQGMVGKKIASFEGDRKDIASGTLVIRGEDVEEKMKQGAMLTEKEQISVKVDREILKKIDQITDNRTQAFEAGLQL